MKLDKPSLWVALPAALVVMLLATGAQAHAQTEPPFFQPAACPVEGPPDIRVDCGYLTVPEDHDDPSSGTIRLPVMILRSRSANPPPDPVLYTEGGPGYSSFTAAPYFSRTSLIDERDVIILEQRGNRYAQPSLMCNVSMWWQEAEGSTGCLDSLRAQGIDLSHYTSQQIAADIEALRQALGIDTWNLYGSSYSTRLMLLAMQQHPEGVRSAILDSVNPPDDNRYLHDPEYAVRALSQMFDDCAANAACAAAYPDLEARFYALFSRLNAEPVSLTFKVDLEGHRLAPPRTETVSGYTLVEWMVADAFYGPIYGAGKATYLPLLIDRVEAGQVQFLDPWGAEQLFDLRWSSPDFAWGVYFAINCQNDYTPAAQAALAAQPAAYPELEGYRRYAREIEICALWGLPAAPLNPEPVVGDTPTLIMADAYDPVTAPQWGRRTAEWLSNSRYIELPASGHSETGATACAQAIMRDFVADPTGIMDTSCLAGEPSPHFVLPQDVLLAPGFHRSLSDFDLGNPRGRGWLEVLIVAALAAFLIETVYMLIVGVGWLARPHKRQPAPDSRARLARLLVGALAVLGLTVPVLMTLVNRQLNSNPVMRYFGLPSGYAPSVGLGAVALGFMLLTVVAVILAAAAWVRRWWSLPERGLHSLVAALAIVFAVMLVRWGLVLMLL